MNKISPSYSHSHSHSRAAGKPSDDSKAFDPWIIWVTFRRCWPWAFPAGLVLAGLVAYYIISSFVPSYRAGHLLEANRDWIVFKGVMPMEDDVARSAKSLLYNSIVLDPVLGDPECRKSPSLSNPATAEANLIKNLSVTNAGTDSRLLVTYVDQDPETAAYVCNAVVKSYLQQREAFDNTRVSNLVRWLEPEINRREKEVEDRQRVVQELSKDTLGYAPGKQVSVLENEANLTLVTSLRSEIAELSLQVSIGEFKMNGMTDDDLEGGGTDPTDDDRIERREATQFEIDQMVRMDPNVVEAMAKVKHYENQMTTIMDSGRIGIHRENYDRFEEMAVQWSNYLEKAKVIAETKITKQLNDAVDKKYATDSKNLVRRDSYLLRQEQAQQNDLVNRLAVLKKQYETERLRLEEFGGSTAQLQFAQEELVIAYEVLKKLRERVVAVRTERRQDGAVRTLAAATPPRTPIEKIPYKKLGLASIFAIFVPFGLGLLLELRTKRLTDSNMCGKHGLEVIGEIARLPSGANSSKSRRVFEESIDTLRTSLFLSTDTKDTRTIAVVSSMSGEGKSSVASQLALSIAKATGETVLLVDADLRCPDQHEIFGLEMGPGLSGVLSDTATLTEAIDSSLGDLIHILPAGPLSSSPHRLLSPEKMKKFVQDALEEYSYVVVDTAPVLSAGESLAIAAATDSTLLCVMRDVSRMDNVNRTIRRLEAVGATLAGTVFSGVSARQYAYRYGDYHYSTPEAGITHVS